MIATVLVRIVLFSYLPLCLLPHHLPCFCLCDATLQVLPARMPTSCQTAAPRQQQHWRQQHMASSPAQTLLSAQQPPARMAVVQQPVQLHK